MAAQNLDNLLRSLMNDSPFDSIVNNIASGGNTVASNSKWETQAVKLPDNDYIEFRDPSGNPVGALRWNEGKLKFYGNVESCAEKFGDYLETVMERKIQEEVNRRLERINRYWDVCNDEENQKAKS